MSERKVCILALDGGGIRGILPGVILAALEKKLQDLDGPEVRLADYFDLIAGTSTGGILACGYLVPNSDGRPKWKAEEVAHLYRDKGHKIFDRSPVQMIMKGLTNAKYRADGLEKELERFFEDAQLKDLLRPCLITSYDITNRRAVFFTKKNTSDPTRNYFVRRVARATSAAPTYFRASSIESIEDESFRHRKLSLIDGGMVANNPAMCAYAEARGTEFGEFDDLGDSEEKPTARDMVMISVGTGRTDKKRYDLEDAKDWGAVGWAGPIIDIMMTANSETVDYQLRKMFDTVEGEGGGFYTRLQPTLYLARGDMDDTSEKNLENLWQDGLAYVAQESSELDIVVEKIRRHGPPRAAIVAKEPSPGPGRSRAS